jgi:hypothetical protein
VGSGRGRGWAAVLALALFTAALSVVQPGLLIFMPLGLLLVALAPHRPHLLVLGVLLVVAGFVTPAREAYWYFERGWALLLGGWFLATVAALPRAGFLVRALTAVTGAAASAVLLFATGRASFQRIDSTVADRLRASADSFVAGWRSSGAFDRVGGEVTETLYQAVALQAMVFPALLALASVAALAVAWWGFRRMSGADERPLAPLREFRFHDGLVWLLIAGIALLLLPLHELADRFGSNLLTFMTALYALRGLAVLLVLGGAPGPLALLVGAVLFLLLYPLVVVTTVLVGLSDTWLDIRTRRRAPPEPGA